MMKAGSEVLLVLVGVVVAFLTDFHSFLVARKSDPGARFDWWLSIGRSFAGALAGYGAGVIG